jgi:PKD repeat protein
VTTEYSLDGDSWAVIAPPVPETEYGPNGVTKVGLFVKHDNGGTPADVSFDSFRVDAESCGETGDTTAPRTTHELDPAEPDGDGGWYTSPVEVTLNATDNDGGSGVETTEYRFAGDEEWTAYTEPFTVDDEGEHTIEYRSTDAEGNTESTRSVEFRIDATDPTTTAELNGEAPESQYDGPVEVDLNATDDGSGVRATQIRIDGGEWQPYVEEETILNSAADLEQWEQAGPGGLNWVDEDGGFARTFGGLGMPWYPKEYGDFSLKLQWRDSSTGTNGNAGIFARFPHPVEAVSRPAEERYPCQVGSATSSPAWVAIYCGHEIQINDHQGDTQKTGSIYNFSPNNAEQAQIQPRGTWVDYELRVVGQQYTIIRNGEVIKEFLNEPGIESSRQGDPPTDDRQFTSGYIGLQNHGNPDVIDYRNVRVLPLDDGSVRGPVTVEGDGEHTVEFRSTDVAGNEEDVKSVTFTIGDVAADGTPPVTTHELDQDGPLDPVAVTLSATDPDEPGGGGGEPETHDVNALPAAWDPDTLEIATGDVVRWNFPAATAGAPHDVWVIEPGEAPNSDGREVTSGFKFPGDPPVSETFDEAGTWTWVCKVHSHREATGWEGMVGTAEVTGDGGEGVPGSGVDFTEYRVDGAEDWTRSENTEDEDPFDTTFTVSEPGEHTVEYRSTDNAGNQEDTKSVEFSIAEDEPGAPTVEAFADPSTGAAPLRVQFSAAGLDPDGGELVYDWDFGDGGGAVGQSPVHTYREPATYEAIVTVTDEEGKTASAFVEVVATEQGNQAPVIQAARVDPASGEAPLDVVFSAQATDPDGDDEDLLYLWDFDDGGAAAIGPVAEYSYMRPRTYVATLTVTDGEGAFDTEQIQVVVRNPPGNRPPTIRAVTAAPRSGTAPLTVNFGGAVTDPDGDTYSTVWDFGDGQRAGVANIAHTYRTPGTYTATLTATDRFGAKSTATVQVTISEASRSSGSGVNAPEGGVQGETRSRPSIKAPKRLKLRRAIRRGLRLRVSCEETCRARSVLRISGDRIGASKRMRIRAGTSRTVKVRLDRKVRRNLLAAMRQAGLRRVRVTATTTIRAGGLTRSYPVRLSLRR